MSEPLPQPEQPGLMVDATDPDFELARKNVRWGLALLGLVIVLFAGTILIAFLYLALD